MEPVRPSFFKGVLNALPFAIALWVVVIILGAWMVGLFGGRAQAQERLWHGRAANYDTPPPERYRGTINPSVWYVQNLREWCGRRGETQACARPEINTVYLPVSCAPNRRPMAQRETWDINALLRDPSYCASLRAHEGGHLLGWSAGHER